MWLISRFRPSISLTVFMIGVIALTVSLAIWQFNRAQEKQQLEKQATSRLHQNAITLKTSTDFFRLANRIRPFQRAVVIGHYQHNQDIFLDNRINKQQLGYHVVTPLFFDHQTVMVKRGFVTADVNRGVMPTVVAPPEGQVTVQGTFYFDDNNAFRLSNEPEQGSRRQHLNLTDYQQQTGLNLLSLVLVAQYNEEHPYSNILPISLIVNFKSQRSIGYAWQWLTLSLLTLVFYFILACRQ